MWRRSLLSANVGRTVGACRQGPRLVKTAEPSVGGTAVIPTDGPMTVGPERRNLTEGSGTAQTGAAPRVVKMPRSPKVFGIAQRDDDAVHWRRETALGRRTQQTRQYGTTPSFRQEDRRLSVRSGGISPRPAKPHGRDARATGRKDSSALPKVFGIARSDGDAVH